MSDGHWMKIEARSPNGWALILAHTCPVVDVAALMGGLGVRVTGHMVNDPIEHKSTFELRPVDEGSPEPSLALVASILRHGLSKYPTLVCRSLQES